MLASTPPLPVTPLFLSSPSNSRRLFRFRAFSHLPPLLLSSSSSGSSLTSSAAVLSDSLRVLEWEKVCDCVASFAGTQLGRQAAKEKLWSVDVSYEESTRLLAETAAAVEMLASGVGGMDFSGIDAVSVKSAIERALRGFPLTGLEAMAIASLIQSVEMLQISVKMAIKESPDLYVRFMPIIKLITELAINHQFIKVVYQVIDEAGNVKDSASTEVKRSRERVQALEKKLYILMDKLVKENGSITSSLEVKLSNGRWCIKMSRDQPAAFDGLLLPCDPGFGSLVEPLVAVSLNDELHQARLAVTKAEENVLSKLTDKMLAEVNDIQKILVAVTELDAVFARAKYSTSYGGSFPDLYLYGSDCSLASQMDSSGERACSSYQRKWKLFLREVYHPLLVHQHKESLQMAKRDVTALTSEIRRARLQGSAIDTNNDVELRLASLRLKAAKIEKENPIPIDVLVSKETGVLVVTGPNTGGKTICLKTIGLASLMAKSGLYVLASEPVHIPWFDGVFADIGDEQSLSQSLSTFSGHLKQISAIRAKSTNYSLVLLDEVGAGTNPLEGAALGMSLLESFAKSGVLLTIATTHHGELKTLKYSNSLFENACVEFDEINLRPTYKILWGVPGRSNAINIAERIGLPENILQKARMLYGSTSAEIDKIITDMEMFKQNMHHHIEEAQHCLMLSRKLHEKLLQLEYKITEYNAMLKTRKTQDISDIAVIFRTSLRNILRQRRTDNIVDSGDETKEDVNVPVSANQNPSAKGQIESQRQHSDRKLTYENWKFPKVGEMVPISSLGKKAMVMEVDESKGQIVVQVNKLKMRIKLIDIESYQP